MFFIVDLPDDMLFLIFCKLNIKSMFEFKLTCKRFYTAVEQINSNINLQNLYQPYNTVTALIELFPNFDWPKNFVNKNPNLSIEYLSTKLPMQNSTLANPCVTQELIKKYHNSIFRERQIYCNPNISVDFLHSIGKMSNINDELLKNPGFKLKDYQEYISKTRQQNINLGSLMPHWMTFSCYSKNPNLTLEDYKNYPDVIDVRFLSKCKNITIDDVNSNPDIPWDHDWLSMNPNITLNIIQQNPHIKWNFKYFSLNPNLTSDIIQANPGANWNYSFICSHLSDIIRLVRDNPQINWNSNMISQNPNINLRDILCEKNIKWNFRHLAENHFNLKKAII